MQEGTGSIPGLGTKIPHATLCGQKKKKKKEKVGSKGVLCKRERVIKARVRCKLCCVCLKLNRTISTGSQCGLCVCVCVYTKDGDVCMMTVEHEVLAKPKNNELYV